MNTTSPHESLLKYIEQRVEGYENTYSLSRGKAFMLWYGVEALSLSEDSSYEAASYDGSNDKSIDFFYVDDENERIIIAQGKFAINGSYNPASNEFLGLVHTTDWLQHPESLARLGRGDLAEAAKDYNEAVSLGYAVDYHYVYMGPTDRAVNEASALFNNANITNSPVRTSRVVNLEALGQLHEEYINAATRIGSATISLHPSQTFQQKGPYGNSLTATIPGVELQKLYDEHGDSLFDRNVRVFLGTRSGSVNAGIRDTIASQDRKNFWAYNNGITIICDRFDFHDESGSLTVHNFSIVNGCQTTVSIANGPKPAPPEISILGRFIAASDSQVVDSIIRYTNSQTPIRPWDISSQDKTQKRLQSEFAEDPNPFFYELRRGESSNLSIEDRRRFTRKSKFHVIRPDILAQNLASFRGLPVEAYRYKTSLFTTHRETVFPTDLRIEEAILAWLAGEAAEEAVKQTINEAKQNDDQKRALILRRGAKLFTLAVMGTILSERNGPTYLAQLNRTTASSNATRQRLAKYAVLALEWYLETMQDYLDAGQDISILLRSQDTFKKIKSKAQSKWKVQSLSPQWVDDALPKL